MTPEDFLRESNAAAATDVPPATPAAQQYNGLHSLVLGLQLRHLVTGTAGDDLVEALLCWPATDRG
ncbi:hypothetical protein AB0D08_21120 [Kitasatospora sp. NPDC048540]|uniref:hypothetical protein n=1 Tax=Kitasatospora sp. NPDC048540 TaxID=3155634 RepID=UPI0033F32E1E